MNDVWTSYDSKNFALEGINLSIDRGTNYAIVGQSGSGKSTLLKLLNALYPCESSDGVPASHSMDINGYAFGGSIYILNNFDDLFLRENAPTYDLILIEYNNNDPFSPKAEGVKSYAEQEDVVEHYTEQTLRLLRRDPYHA